MLFAGILFAAARFFVLVLALHGKTDRSVCDQRGNVACKAEIKTDIQHIYYCENQSCNIQSEYDIEKDPRPFFTEIFPEYKDQKIYSFKSIQNSDDDH